MRGFWGDVLGVGDSFFWSGLALVLLLFCVFLVWEWTGSVRVRVCGVWRGWRGIFAFEGFLG